MEDVVFSLEIKIGNAAMKEVGDLAEALRKLADRVDEGNVNGVIRDDNGNTVGGFRLDLAEDELGNEDGSNRDVPPFDNDPRTDDEIKQAVYDEEES